MTQVQCPGLPADWVNAWLAAVGTTVLDQRIRLHWASHGLPVAVLSAQESDPVECLIESWPDAGFLADLPVAETWRGTTGLRRKVPVEAFRERVQVARGLRHSWTLSSSMTDLCVDKDGLVAHAPFDPSGPGTIKWLHHRLEKVHKHVDKNANHIQNALMGQPDLANDNGLGFDHGRLGASSDKTDRLVNPVVEVLAFFGLSLLPARGPGGDRCLDRSANITVRQKGWLMHERRKKFHWPAWEQPLDRNGIDALLDTWHALLDTQQPSSKSEWELLGIYSAWRSVEYESDGDYTQAFGSERL